MTDERQDDGPHGEARDDARVRSDANTVRPAIGRRSVLNMVGAGAITSVAGCLSADSETGPGDDGEAPGTDEDGTAGTGGSGDGDGTDSDGDDSGADDDGGSDPNTAHDVPFEESFDTTDRLHSDSDTAVLGFDTTDPEQFARPGGAEADTDDSRLNRTTEDDAAVVFRFAEAVGPFRLEAHLHPDYDAAVTVEASADRAEWTEVETERELYSEAHGDETEPGHWWQSYEYSGVAPEGSYYLRFTLSGPTDWTPQLGHLTVESETDVGSAHSLPFEDDLDDLAALHTSSDLSKLGIDSTNTGQFAARPDAEADEDPARLNRTTTGDASAVYEFESAIQGFSAEVHYHNEEQGSFSVAVSPDGDQWTEIDPGRALYSEAHDDEDAAGTWWENYEYTSDDLPGEPTVIRFTLAGDVDWSPQLGRVEIR